MKVGLIGAGAIANYLLKTLHQSPNSNMQITSVLVRNKEKHRSLESKFGVTLYTDIEAFLETEIDIVVEAANIHAVHTLLPTVLKKKDVVLISIGALAESEFLKEVEQLVQHYKNQIYLPSGAIGGLDLLQNAHALGTVESVTLITRKPAYSLIEEDIKEEKVIFEGKAVDAIKEFPKNVNVSIVLSLAGLGVEQTKMILIADPHIERNVHEIEIKGDFGEATICISNNPLPDNPKTSYLAAMSIIGTLKRLDSSLKIG